MELGWFDILYEVAKLSSHNVMPLKGHLEVVYNTFVYLGKHENSKMIFEHSRPVIDESGFVESD